MTVASGLGDTPKMVDNPFDWILLSSSLTSYDVTIWANMVLSSVAAKNRPGLVECI